MTRQIPEILAPAGGRQQFFAALASGADAVYLGLKHFNARARAENFSLDDLAELIPLAHRSGMKVLVTLNILIKENELPLVVDQLVALEALGVDAVIVQDLGVVGLIKRFAPSLRIHGSTQMAIHNLAGIQKAREMGVSRVVLAREMTATELLRIRRALGETSDVEIEVFCHGSLCYSYSGLCFFSGAADARSGNRGECAYTCRKPYKIVSEEGQGFLFSMKDLDTSQLLNELVLAGVHTLKIEGRKKDAQYVSATVKLYRQRLDELFGFATGRPTGGDHRGRDTKASDRAKLADDLKLAFQRDLTGFFVKGRYHENVIDLDHSSHQGLAVGPVLAVRHAPKETSIQFRTQVALDRFDGIRIIPGADEGALLRSGAGWETAVKRYQNQYIEFSLRDARTVSGSSSQGPLTSVAKGSLVEVKIPQAAGSSAKGLTVGVPQKGDLIYKVRSQSLKERTEKLAQPPRDHRPHQRRPVDLRIEWLPGERDGQKILQLRLTASVCGQVIHSLETSVSKDTPLGASTLKNDLDTEFRVFGTAGFYAQSLILEGANDCFIPRSQLKQIKNEFSLGLVPGYEKYLKDRQRSFASHYKDHEIGPLDSTGSEKAVGVMSYVIKIDRLERLGAVETLQKKRRDIQIAELVFEPKKAFLNSVAPDSFLDQLDDFSRRTGISWRMALPTVIRGWDEPLVKLWTTAALKRDFRDFEVGNLGALKLLEDWNQPFGGDLSIVGDFTFYGLNSEATAVGRELGLSGMTLSIEDDQTNLKNHLARLLDPLKSARNDGVTAPVAGTDGAAGRRVADYYTAIVYKDTPLFIAEACTLTALHKGCPTSKVCGYRTLEVENAEGQRFFVAHETCKSIVYGAEAYSITQWTGLLNRWGVKRARLDFLTRPYTDGELIACCEAAFDGRSIRQTHSANFCNTLL